MADVFEFISPTDQPALIGLSTPEWVARSRAALIELNYKVHVAANQEDFIDRFNRVHYQVVLIEELFACASYQENRAVYELQRMPMSQRRHAAVLLLGDSFQSLNPMQAFQQSVHVVVNGAEIGSIKPIIQKTVAENDLFLQGLRDTLMQITTWGK